MEIHNNLKQIRIGRGFTQAELALRTGMSKEMIYSLEAGRRSFSKLQLGYVVRLMETLGVTFKELVG